MKENRLVLILLFVLSLFSVIFFVQGNYAENNQQITLHCTPTFADGDGPYYYRNTPFRTKLVPDKNNGEKLIVEGKVLQSNCQTPLSNVVLDIWQANEKGNYQKDWYRGKVKVDSNGKYRFETVIPKGYGEGTAYRPPHIHFKVWQNNQLIITSEMFFPDVKGKTRFNDAYIMKFEKKNEWGKQVSYGHHDIILP